MGENSVTRAKKKIDSEKFTIGASVGVTINMGNFESLRLDCWGEAPYSGDPEDAKEALDGLMEDLEEYVNDKAAAYKALKTSKISKA